MMPGQLKYLAISLIKINKLMPFIYPFFTLKDADPMLSNWVR